MEIRSSFKQGAAIPAKYTCDGENVSPPLDWSSIPERARSLVLIVDDPDAPDPAAPRRVWVHWILYNIPATVTGLAEALETLPAGTREGLNDWKSTGYRGPCPPVGRHRYFHRLHALDRVLPDLHEPTRETLEHAMQGHIVGRAELMGTYQRAEDE